eukprot:1285337-Ditylum_brightwellii.AAC.1
MDDVHDGVRLTICPLKLMNSLHNHWDWCLEQKSVGSAVNITGALVHVFWLGMMRLDGRKQFIMQYYTNTLNEAAQ